MNGTLYKNYLPPAASSHYNLSKSYFGCLHKWLDVVILSSATVMAQHLLSSPGTISHVIIAMKAAAFVNTEQTEMRDGHQQQPGKRRSRHTKMTVYRAERFMCARLRFWEMKWCWQAAARPQQCLSDKTLRMETLRPVLVSGNKLWIKALLLPWNSAVCLILLIQSL